jgi:hypothetical protein
LKRSPNHLFAFSFSSRYNDLRVVEHEALAQ